MRTTNILPAIALLALLATPALGQSTERIFNVELGSAVDQLPTDQWVDPACGTNGGPPSIELSSFADFRLCPVEPDTGLREVWFIYDDEWEYIARAYRDPVEIGRFSANTFYNQPVITSLLIDADGYVQGYRVITDPGTPSDIRQEAYLVLDVFKTLFSEGTWQCQDLPPGERESPVNGVFFKTDCTKITEQLFVSAIGRMLRKPGQDFLVDPPEGYFEGLARLEVYAADQVMDQACCQAFWHP